MTLEEKIEELPLSERLEICRQNFMFRSMPNSADTCSKAKDRITELEGENRRLRDVVVNLVSADYAHEDEFSAQIQCLGCDSRFFDEWADVKHAEDCEYLQELADVMASTTEGGSRE